MHERLNQIHRRPVGDNQRTPHTTLSRSRAVRLITGNIIRQDNSCLLACRPEASSVCQMRQS
jgi:hypothetical protein